MSNPFDSALCKCMGLNITYVLTFLTWTIFG